MPSVTLPVMVVVVTAAVVVVAWSSLQPLVPLAHQGLGSGRMMATLLVVLLMVVVVVVLLLQLLLLLPTLAGLLWSKTSSSSLATWSLLGSVQRMMRELRRTARWRTAAS